MPPLPLQQLLVHLFLLATASTAWRTSVFTFARGPASGACDRNALRNRSARNQICRASDEWTADSRLSLSRRTLLEYWTASPIIAVAGALLVSKPLPALAADTTSSLAAEITDRIYVDVKGLPSAAAGSNEPKRIVIGLFGKAAPACVAQIKKLVSAEGLAAPCRPRAERMLQKEQLESNKVFNSCKESEDVGVNLRYSTIWRIIKDERIDMGAVTGRYVAREFPEFKESVESGLKHDAPGVVSVRRGNDSGFGFTIYPGGDGTNVDQLDEDHIVVGRVIEGMDVVRELNEVPVVMSAKVNYMALTGGPKTTNAPDRSCRYGGPMYCNENKPLVKLSITTTGILNS